MGGSSKRSAYTATAPAWIPVALIAASAFVPVLRLPVLLAVAAVAGVALLRRPATRPAGAWIAWISVLPVAVGLAVGLVPDPAVADPGACDDLLAVLAMANAAMEEAAYRGVVQRWGAGALGRGGAIVAQALMFGSAHQGADVLAGGPLLWVGIVAGGLVAGVVADRTRSLLLPFAVHVAVDVPLALALTCRFA